MHADASDSSRQLRVPRQALKAIARRNGPGADNNAHQGVREVGGQQPVDGEQPLDVEQPVDGEQHVNEQQEDPDMLPEDQLAGIGFQPVLTDFTCDWPGRSKLTNWLQHNAQFNGGWCMCNTKGNAQVRCTSILPRHLCCKRLCSL